MTNHKQEKPKENNKTWEADLRKDFQDFADSIIWSNDAGDEKYIGVGNMADWWVDKLSQALDTQRKDIVGSLKKLKQVPVEIPHGSPYISGFNTAIEEGVKLIEGK